MYSIGDLNFSNYAESDSAAEFDDSSFCEQSFENLNHDTISQFNEQTIHNNSINPDFDNIHLNSSLVQDPQLDILTDYGEITCLNLNSLMKASKEGGFEYGYQNYIGKEQKIYHYMKMRTEKSNHKIEEKKNCIKKIASGGISKKQSNKEAATRYRQKKNKEKEDLFTTRELYKKENNELKKKIEDIQTEINFVKNILVEMLLKKV